MYKYEMGAVIASVQARHGLHSHEQIGAQLGVTAKTVSNWLHGRNYPDDRVIVLLADLAGLDREAFAAYIQAMRSPTREGRETWLRCMRRLLDAANSADPDARVLGAPAPEPARLATV